MGAEVVKIEPPGAGDPMRQWGRGEHPLWWEVIARNKKSVSADLRTPEGRDLARRLIGRADILIENFRPGTLEGWGLEPQALLQENPRLIVVRVSGYGQTGPYAKRAGYGGIGEAMGGWRYVVGEADRPPSRMGISIGDTLAATYGALGALAALRHRDVTGQGQIVDSAIYEAVLQVMESLVPDYSAMGYVRERSGSILPGLAPSNVYRCSDGELLIAGNQDTVFRRLCQVMGRPELADDPRYATHSARGERQGELDALIDGWTRSKTVSELEDLCEAGGVPAGRIFRAPEMLADPQFQARGAIIDVPHPRWGALKMQNVFPKLSATPGAVRTPAPAEVGQDNAEVYAALGLGASDLDELKRRQII
jgi:formyl-CoA transferase